MVKNRVHLGQLGKLKDKRFQLNEGRSCAVKFRVISHSTGRGYTKLHGNATSALAIFEGYTTWGLSVIKVQVHTSIWGRGTKY